MMFHFALNSFFVPDRRLDQPVAPTRRKPAPFTIWIALFFIPCSGISIRLLRLSSSVKPLNQGRIVVQVLEMHYTRYNLTKKVVFCLARKRRSKVKVLKQFAAWVV